MLDNVEGDPPRGKLLADVLPRAAGTPPKKEQNTFRQLYDTGFRYIVPILPPGAPLWEKSHLTLKLEKGGKDNRGKAPGVKRDDGKWTGFGGWQHAKPDEATLQRWSGMGAGVGIRTGLQHDGTYLYAFDADTKVQDCADTIRKQLKTIFGDLPTRIGDAPKALYLVRCSGPIPYTQFGFDGGVLELLGEGKQFVSVAIHPGTMKPYFWTTVLRPLDELPVQDPEAIIGAMNTLRSMLPKAGDLYQDGGGDRRNTPQRQLVGDPDMVERALRLIPNVHRPPGRQNFVKMAAAARGAFQDDYERGRDAFVEWAEKAEIPEPEDDPADTYKSMKAPFSVGAPWLYELAEAADTTGEFKKAAAIAVGFYEEDAGAAAAEAQAAVEEAKGKVEWFCPTEWEGRPEKPREWLLKGWIPHGVVTALYGDGGIGKTLVAQQLATAMATGQDFLGQPTRPCRVLCVFCEDDMDELHRRQNAINRALGVTNSDLKNLKYTSRANEPDNLLATFDRSGKMDLQPFYDTILKQAQDFKADLIIIDTLADTSGANEIDRAQVNAFVKGGLGGLARGIGGSVLALAHPSQAGKNSGDGTSGSTAWNNAVRSRLYLSVPKANSNAKTNTNLRNLQNMKANYGPSGAVLKIEWRRGAFYLVAATPAGSTGGEIPGIPTLEAFEDATVIRAVVACSGIRMTMGKTTAYNAEKVLRGQCPKILGSLSRDEVWAALERLRQSGVVEDVEVGRDRGSRPLTGFRVNPDKLSAAAATAEKPPDVFD